MINKLSCSAVLLLAMAGCASDPQPTEQLQLTAQSIAQAKAVGATNDIESLKQAEAKLQLADQAVAQQQFKEARMLAEQAELDAREAEADYLVGQSEVRLQELNKQINRLRTQLRAQQ